MPSTEPPDSTKAPVVVDAAEGSITIEWEPPTFDGGRPISGYLIEKRETSSPRWSKATKQPVKGTDFTADDLIPGAEYEFRVSAINKAGTGQPSEPSKATLARVPIGKFSNHSRVFTDRSHAKGLITGQRTMLLFFWHQEIVAFVTLVYRKFLFVYFMPMQQIMMNIQ